MNGQINYIVHASLLLVVTAATVLFIRTLPASLITSQQEAWCATEESQTAVLSENALQGKTLFMTRCASCHHIFKNTTGPSLMRFTEKEPWTNRQNVYDWIRNPAVFMQKNEYARNLFKQYGTMMQAFPDMTDEEIDAVCAFLESY